MNASLRFTLRPIVSRPSVSLFLAVLASLICAASLPPPAFAQAAGGATSAVVQPTARVRGTLVYADANHLIVKSRGGEVVTLARAAGLTVSEVYPIQLAAIRQGDFVGITAKTRPGGRLAAVEVHLFPESMRGTGEGHYPWDLFAGSTMTNATVIRMAPVAERGGRELDLRYRGGEKTIVVPPGIPIVKFKPGGESLLKPGAKVMVIAEQRSGTLTALRAVTGRGGITPPM